MELRTLQAPVPQDKNMIPTRPIMEAFSVMLAFITGVFWPFASVYSCHSIPAKSGPDPHPPAYVHHPDTLKRLFFCLDHDESCTYLFSGGIIALL